MKIVIIGGSFGGLTTAHELRRLLGAKRHEIMVISKERRFVFIPSLPWVAMGTKTIEQISFDLERPLTRKGIRFVHASVRQVDAKSQKVYTQDGEYAYDYLVLATGHRSANEAVPGLGPFDGPDIRLCRHPKQRRRETPGRRFYKILGLWWLAAPLGLAAWDRPMSLPSRSITCFNNGSCGIGCRLPLSPRSPS